MSIKVNSIVLDVLSLFTVGYNKDYYIREVARTLNISSRTALLTLASLEKEGVLQSKIRGKIKTYSILKSITSREMFILVEQHKKINFFEKNLVIKEIFEETEDFIDGLVFVFGSYAKGTQNDISDLDLFIVGDYDEEKLQFSGKKYGIDINIKSYPLNLFKQELHDDILLKEVLEDHILINGVEAFVKMVLKWIK